MQKLRRGSAQKGTIKETPAHGSNREQPRANT